GQGPAADHLVGAAGDQPLAVRAQHGSGDRIRVSQRPARHRRHGPEFQQAIPARSDELRSLGMISDSRYRAGMGYPLADDLVIRGIPKEKPMVGSPRRERVSLRSNGTR